MAPFTWTVVQSRVGRRVAALYVLSGLLPLLVLAGITSSMVSRHLLAQEEGRLRFLAKESAMASLGRLLDTEERLRALAVQPAGTAPTAVRGVAALAWVDAQGRVTPLVGRVDPPRLDDTDRARLAAGDAVLRQPSQAGGPMHLVVPISRAPRIDSATLVAAIDARGLWAFDDRASDGAYSRDICAAAGRTIIACSDERLDRDALAAIMTGGNGAGTFATRQADQDWMGAYWSAPLRAHYGTAQMTSVLFTRTADAMAPAHTLLRTFVLLVVAATCVLLLVSLRQIRRLLDPIARLQAGTASLARGDFSARVDVRTDDEFQALGDSFNAMAVDLQHQFDQLHALSVGTLEALARTIDAKSPWTAGHSTRVAEIAVAIGRALQFPPATIERLRRGALLHDIGKIGISSEILDSPLPLTDAQRAIIQQHPGLGARILEPLPHCADIVPMVLQHHERFDGKGYPAGIAGAAIHIDARILAVADVYDAMTSERPYRRGLPARDAAIRISESAGSHFDPAVVEAFMAAFRNRRLPEHPPELGLPNTA